MPKYEVTLWDKMTFTCQVDADTEEGTIEAAEDLASISENDDWTSDGYCARIVNKVEKE